MSSILWLKFCTPFYPSHIIPLDNILSRVARKDEVSRSMWIYWTLTLVAENNYDTLTVCTEHIKSSGGFTSRCFVAASTAEGSLPLGCPTTSGFSYQLLTTATLNVRNNCRVGVRITLRLAVYRQSVRLGAKSLESHDQRPFFFFGNWTLAVIVLTEHPLWREDGFVSYKYPWPLSSICIAHIACYWKLFLLNYAQVLCQYRLCKADHAYLTYLMLQRRVSHLNGRALDHRQV
jgi:hypothetical protein